MIIIKKASPGLDQRNRLGKILGDRFAVEDYDPTLPLERQVAQADVLLVRDIAVPRSVIDAAPKLKLIQRPGAHIRDVDVPYANSRGIAVCRIPVEAQGGGPEDVAEHAFYLLMALAKKQGLARASIKTGKVGVPKTVRLRDKTLALVGLGATGTALARIAVGFGMRVVAVRRSADPELQKRLALDFLGDMQSLPNILSQADAVSLHLPVTPETTCMIGKEELAYLKPSAFLINISRAPLIDRNAFLQALREDRIGGAGFDVLWEEPVAPDDELLSFRNVIVSPHIAGDTEEVEQMLATVTAENIRLVVSGQNPKHPVA